MIAGSSPDESVIVVGAGPAGATAARALAAAGVRVRLLDRAAFPRNKPCGGGISMRVVRRFPYLAAGLRRIATHEIRRLYLEGPTGASTVIESDEPAALMIRRVEFDALLVALALEAGVDLVCGVDVIQAKQDVERVTLTARDGRRFTAPVVIAADGVHSVIARRLGLNPGWAASSVALDMMEETPRDRLRDLDPSTLWVSYGYGQGFGIRDSGFEGGEATTENAERTDCAVGRRRSVLDTRERDGASASARGSGAPREVTNACPEGYAYIFPKRDHVNIGVGYVLSYFRSEIDDAPYDLQRGFIDQLRRRGIVVGESAREHFTPYLIPVGGPLRTPGRGRVLLAGDAGGFVNGFTAEGIYYAMVSGELAAQAVVAARSQPARLAAVYCRACDHEIGGELRDSVLIQRYLFADRRRIVRVIDGANRERTVTRLILDYAAGRRSYRAVRRAILARSPLLGARLAIERLKENIVGTRASHYH
jgi:flavin-dependent dehydrogenase